jgi:hypothetical protein
LATAIDPIVEWLDTKTVACSKECLRFSIPDGECKHASEAIETLGPPFTKRSQKDFGIGATSESISKRPKLFGQLAVVIDLTVVSDPIATRLIGHGLMTCVTKVKYGQTAMPQRHTSVIKKAFSVRPSMPLQRDHAPDG